MNLRKGFVLLVVLATFVLCERGQEPRTGASEIDALLRGAVKLRSSLAYRATESAYSLKDGNSTPELISTWTAEYSPTNNWRTITWKLGKPGGEVLVDRRSIGDYIFEKRGSGEWTKEARSRPSESYSPPSCDKNSDTSRKVECVHIGRQLLNGASLEVYQITIATTSKRSGRESVQIQRRRYWLNTTGLILKEELEEEVVGSKGLRRGTSEYSYDQSIKIEAPIQ